MIIYIYFIYLFNFIFYDTLFILFYSLFNIYLIILCLSFVSLFLLYLVLFCFVSLFSVVCLLFVVRDFAIPPTCESKSACKFSKTHQKQAPTAMGIGVSCRAREMLLKTGFDIEKGARKVCFTAGTLCL